MQAALVITVALAGLGCQNKPSDLSDVPPVYDAIESVESVPYPRYATPSSYSGYYPRTCENDVSDVYPTHWDALHATLVSFVLGRDPGVTTAAEIEASVFGDRYHP
jgi:hypothetical protein